MGFLRTMGLGIVLRFKQEASGQMGLVGSRIREISTEGDQAISTMDKLTGRFKAGAKLFVGGAALAGALLATVPAASAFQSELRNTMTMTDLTGEKFRQMEEDMGRYSLLLSSRLGIDAREINESFYQVLSSGATAMSKDFKGLAETSLMLSRTVKDLPAAAAVEGLSDALHAFDMKGKSAARTMADMLFTSSKLGATTVPQLVEAMKQAAPVAKTFDVHLATTNTLLTAFASRGFKGSEGGMAFRQMLMRLYTPMGEGKKGFEMLAKESGMLIKKYDALGKRRGIIDILADLKTALNKTSPAMRDQTLKMIAGEEAFSRISGLLEMNIDDLRQWEKRLKVGGALAKAFSDKQATFSDQFGRFGNQIKNIAIGIGTQLLPLLTRLFRGLNAILVPIVNFGQAHPVLFKVIALVTGLGAVVMGGAGAVLMLGSALGMLNLMLTSMATAAGVAATNQGILKLAWLVSKGSLKSLIVDVKAYGAALLVGAKKLLVFAAIHAKDAAVAVASFAARMVVAAATGIGSFIAAMPVAIASTWAFTAALLANPITWIVLGVVALVAGLVLLVKHFDKVKAAIGSVFGWIVSAGKKVWAWFDTTGGKIFLLMSPIGTLIFLVKNFGKIWDWLKEKAGTALGWIGKQVQRIPIVGALVKAFGILKQFSSGKMDMSQAGRALVKTLAKGILDMMFWPYKAFFKVLGKLRKLLPFSDAEEGPLSDIAKSGRSFIRSFAEGFLSGFSILKAAAGKVFGFLAKAARDPLGTALSVGKKLAGLVGAGLSKAATFGRRILGLGGGAAPQAAAGPALGVVARPPGAAAVAPLIVERPRETMPGRPAGAATRAEGPAEIPVPLRERIIERIERKLEKITLPITVLLDGKVIYEMVKEFSEDEATRRWKPAPSFASSYMTD